MYGVPEVSNNRLPRAANSPAHMPSIGRTVGTALAQAAAVVIVAKVVDVLFEAFMSRRRAKQPERSRHDEPVGV